MLVVSSFAFRIEEAKNCVYTRTSVPTAALFGHILNACDGAVCCQPSDQVLCQPNQNSYYICCGNSSEFLMLVCGLSLK